MAPEDSITAAGRKGAGDDKHHPPSKSKPTSKSSTEDPDSEAFWAAQEGDFTFFADEKGGGDRLPSPPPPLPPRQQQQQQQGKIDVVKEVAAFRRERRAAFEQARGLAFVEGYWEGEVRVVRGGRGKVGLGERFEGVFGGEVAC